MEHIIAFALCRLLELGEYNRQLLLDELTDFFPEHPGRVITIVNSIDSLAKDFKLI